MLPGIGEAEDLLWGPLSAIAVSRLFNSPLLTGIELVKELLPGTDLLPLATIAWTLEYVFDESDVGRILNAAIKLRK